MANLNINSLLKHIDELRVIMADTSLHILAINETKIDNLVSDNEIRISGYNIIRKDRNRKGGGVLMYLHESITFLERIDLCPDSLEMICLEIMKPHNRSFLVSHGTDHLILMSIFLMILSHFSKTVKQRTMSFM